MTRRPYTVILVDDEPSFLKMLQKVVPWQELNVRIAGTAGDGETALELIRREQPDVVVTDIKMPVMDGLDLIRACWEEIGTSIRFIIISGYDDFHYARQAIHYHVRNYLLKPLDVEELVRQMEITIREIEQESLLRGELKRQSASLMRDVFAQLATQDKTSCSERGEADVEALLQSGYYLLMVLIESDEPMHALSEQDYALRRGWVIETFFQLSGPVHDAVHFVDEEGRIVLLLSDLVLHKRNLDLTTFLHVFRRMLLDDHRIGTSMTASQHQTGCAGVGIAYRQVCRTMNQRLYDGRNLVRQYHETYENPYTQRVDGVVQPQQIVNRIAAADLDGMRVDLDQVFGLFRANKVALRLIHAYLQALGFHLVNLINSYQGSVEDWNAFGLPFPENTSGMTLDALKNRTITFCEQAADFIRQLKSEGETSVVAEVKAYLATHFMESLSLRDMAKRFFINPVYLGQRFRSEVGMGFVEYLQKLRMEEAVRLLNETTEKIETIAKRVGYRDKNYFTALFHEAVGMPPSQFRNQL